MEKDADQRPIDTNLEEDCQASVAMGKDAGQGYIGTNSSEKGGQDSETCAAISGGQSEEPPAAAYTTVQAASGSGVAEPRRQRIRRYVFPQFKFMLREKSSRIFPHHRYNVSARGTAAKKTVISTDITPADGRRPDTSRTAADANFPLRDAATGEKSDALITGGGLDSGGDASQGFDGDHSRWSSSFSRVSSTGSLHTVQEGIEYAPKEEVDSPVSLENHIKETERSSSVPETPSDWQTSRCDSSPCNSRRRSFSYDDDDNLITMYIDLARAKPPRETTPPTEGV